MSEIDDLKHENEVLKEVITMMTGHLTGLSGMTMTCHMVGTSTEHPYQPLDMGDAGRCANVLIKFPQWIMRLDEMVGIYGWTKVEVEMVRTALAKKASHG